MSRINKVTNADHPTRSMKNGHIPLPWVVDYHILGFLIFKDWQVHLHSETSSCMCLPVATYGCSHHCQVQRTSIASCFRTPTPIGGWASRGASRNLHQQAECEHHLPHVYECTHHQFFSPPNWKFPHPDLTSNLQYNRWPLGTGWVVLTPGGTQALWPSFSSPWWCLLYLVILPAWCLWSLLPVLFSWPN